MKDGEWMYSHARDEYISEYGVIGYRGTNWVHAKFYNHMPAWRIKELVSDKTWNEYFKFCVVRNPYDKLISAFFHFNVKKNNVISTKDKLISRFRDWIRNQKNLINDRDKYIIDGSFCVDDVIKAENMQSDLERICKRIGVPYEPNNLLRLKSGFTPTGIRLHDFYDSSSDNIVKRFYDYEFEHFGYQYLDNK